jgi:pSer/pThr/pTyr-binding forkhead associated (FHA) protein
MKMCTACTFPNTDRLAFCESCGEPLVSEVEQMEVPEIVSTESTVLVALRIAIIIPPWLTPIQMSLTENITLGRYDDKRNIMPDLDLTPYGAQEKGVSRQHAAIALEHGAATLCDLQSSNGTFLNGNPLPPMQPWILRDGDEIMLGKLICKIRVESSE